MKILTRKEFIEKNGLKSEQDSNLDELTGTFNKYNDYLVKEIQSLKDEGATKEEMVDLKHKWADEKFDQIEKVQKQQGLELAKMSKGSKAPVETFSDQIKELLEGGRHDAIDRLKKSARSTDEGYVVKAAGAMSLGTNYINGAEVPLQYETGYDRVVRRQPFVLDLVSRGVATSNTITWYEQANLDGGATPTAEGGTKPLFDFDIEQKDAKIRKIAVAANVTMELLDDAPQFESFLRSELFRDLRLAVDAQLLNGDGTGQNLEGLFTMASAYSAGSFALAIDEANNWDVLTTAIDQIEIAEFMPTDILMYPSDVTSMKLTKATDGQYVVQPVHIAGESMNVGGVPIVKNTGIAQDNFLIGDMTRPIVYEKGGVFLRVGESGNDFRENRITIIAEWRGLQKITTNSVPALVKGTFTAAKAALETA